jgi:hypothetical protein
MYNYPEFGKAGGVPVSLVLNLQIRRHVARRKAGTFAELRVLRSTE